MGGSSEVNRLSDLETLSLDNDLLPFNIIIAVGLFRNLTLNFLTLFCLHIFHFVHWSEDSFN